MRGSHTFRAGALGARLFSCQPAQCSVSKRLMQASTVGRETCKNRLMLIFSQPWAYNLITCRRAWERSGGV